MPIYNFTCKQCKKDFTHRKKDKKFCGTACWKQSRKKFVTSTCEACNQEFTVAYRFRNQKFCDRKCMGLGNKMKTKYHMTTCLWCKNKFKQPKNKKYQKQYCSYECFNLKNHDGHIGSVSLTCEACNKIFNKSYIQRDRRFCSHTCASTGVNNGMYGKIGKLNPMFGKIAWNHGLTVNTDTRIKNLGKKISKTLKRKFASGEMSNAGVNNSQYGRTPDTRTPEQLNNYSKAAIKRIKEGKVLNYKRGKKGYYTSTKNGKKMFYRSGYELRTMKYLDNNDDVVNYFHECVTILYGADNNKRYLPDFVVEFKAGNKMMIEVKAKYFLKTHKKSIKQKSIAAKKYCDEHNMKFEIWTKAKLDKVGA